MGAVYSVSRGEPATVTFLLVDARELCQSGGVLGCDRTAIRSGVSGCAPPHRHGGGIGDRRNKWPLTLHVVDELAAIVGVDPSHREWHRTSQSINRSHHEGRLPNRERYALGPTGRDIGQRQRVNEVPDRVPAAMRHEVNLHEPGLRISPVGECAPRDLSLDGGLTSMPLALRLAWQSRGCEKAIDRGGSHVQEPPANHVVETQMACPSKRPFARSTRASQQGRWWPPIAPSPMRSSS